MTITKAQRAIVKRVSQDIDHLEALLEMMGGLSEKSDEQYLPCATAVKDAIGSTAERLNSDMDELQSVRHLFDSVLDLQLETCSVDAGVGMLNHLFESAQQATTPRADFRRLVDFCVYALESAVDAAKGKALALKEASAGSVEAPARISAPTTNRRRSKPAEKATA